MPSKNSKKVTKGSNALSKIISYSKDQVRGAVQRRYIKSGGLNQVKDDLRMLRRMLNTEAKHVDTITTITNVVATASVVQAVGTMAEGLDSNQRTGRSIKINRIDATFAFQYSTGTPATTSLQNQIFNWYFIKYNKTPSSSGATAFNISELLLVDPSGNYTPLSLPNPDTNENFSILASGEVNVVLHEATTVQSTAVQLVNLTIDKAFHQTFNSTTAASITDNMCFIVYTGLQGLNTGGVSNVASSIRMWYVDN